MTIEFDKIKLEDEEAQAALKTLLGNETFTSYVTEAVTNREEAVRSSAVAEIEPLKGKVNEFRETNVKLKERLEELEGVDPDEYRRLKALGSDANAANETMKRMDLEHRGQIEGRDAKISELTEQVEKLAAQREEDAFRFAAQAAIQRHNAERPAVAVEQGAEDALVREMLAAHKKVDGQIVMLAGDRDFTTDDGIGSMDDWINVHGRKTLHYLFKKPTGGGASGSTSGGAGQKSYGEMSEQERVALHRSDPALFTRLRTADRGNRTAQ